MSDTKDYEDIACEVAQLTMEKNKAYGDSFGKAGNILKILYPDGIACEQYTDVLAIIRVIDKLFRLANKKDAFDESPWRDICGYSLLGISNDENQIG